MLPLYLSQQELHPFTIVTASEAKLLSDDLAGGVQGLDALSRAIFP